MVESHEQVAAWLAHGVGRCFRPVKPVAWLEAGKDLQHLLPWEQYWRQQRAEQAEIDRIRLLRPHCLVERHWLRQMFSALACAAGSPPAPGTFEVTFDGEMLKVYMRGRVVGVPALGAAWGCRFSGRIESMGALPRRLFSDPVEVGIWSEHLEIERSLMPVTASTAATSVAIGDG